jgi:hypothetical protein
MENYQDFKKIDHIFLPTTSEFNQHYGSKFKPVLIEGLMDNWAAKTKWTPDFFRNRFGNLKVQTARSSNRKDKKIFTLHDYFNYMETSDEVDPYYLTNAKFHLKTEMMNDYQIPPYFENKKIIKDWLLSFRKLSWMYIGAKNTFSRLHLDIFDTNAWNAVVSGKKIWLFYDPGQAEYLYYGQVNPFEPNLIKYPKFINAKPIVCVQNPGDVVFTPSGWWHTVYNEEAGVSITENFVNEINSEMVKRQLLEHRKLIKNILLRAPVSVMKRGAKALLSTLQRNGALKSIWPEYR